MSPRHSRRLADDDHPHNSHYPHHHPPARQPHHRLPSPARQPLMSVAVNGAAAHHSPHLNGTPATQPAAHPQPNGVPLSSVQKLAQANESTWLLIGAVAEQMQDLERAQAAYENALRHNPHSVPSLMQLASIARIKENYAKAVDYFQRVIHIQPDHGESWSAVGHCYLMQDDLQKAYAAYQQALYWLPNPKEDPKLWYGIGILYDRYGSLDHAEEAFASVLRMDRDFDKANEILFRLGIIYKQQGKYAQSLEVGVPTYPFRAPSVFLIPRQCFERILRSPPNPLAHVDIWFQMGHVFEQQKDYHRAKDAYERVVQDKPHHAKVLQQLGWLHHQPDAPFQNQDLAIQYLTKSLEADATDAQSWYLLGRAYMQGQKYNKAYEAYQQAVYRDGRNPTFWCSIGVLYFQINQYRDALDAYSRAIRINPYISEVWFDLGSLYESCNNQISDAIDAYARASELDPQNNVISHRLALLKNAQMTGNRRGTKGTGGRPRRRTLRRIPCALRRGASASVREKEKETGSGIGTVIANVSENATGSATATASGTETETETETVTVSETETAKRTRFPRIKDTPSASRRPAPHAARPRASTRTRARTSQSRRGSASSAARPGGGTRRGRATAVCRISSSSSNNNNNNNRAPAARTTRPRARTRRTTRRRRTRRRRRTAGAGACATGATRTRGTRACSARPCSLARSAGRGSASGRERESGRGSGSGMCQPRTRRGATTRSSTSLSRRRGGTAGASVPGHASATMTRGSTRRAPSAAAAAEHNVDAPAVIIIGARARVGESGAAAGAGEGEGEEAEGPAGEGRGWGEQRGGHEGAEEEGAQ
ncbi:hypothetical protein JB92DRAFT_337066 [Gautieria morchelliformis]|nr:hypothetical protein JB92DRAFT_337066 [Gautieria morchelliformis]